MKISKGKARQGKLFGGAYRAVDDEFLDYIDTLRLDLARGFVAKNLDINSAELTEATQKTIDRLVFIRFLEDKQIEYDDHIYHIKKWKDFISLSKAFDTKYNGVVFKPSIIDDSEFSGIDDTLFMDICIDISSKESPYNFNAIPIHIIGNIYERFLGKIVAIDNGKVAIELKPSVRKAGGVFYTPKYAVDYIVSNTIDIAIKNKTPKEIDQMSFADIACGSGSFLIGVYESLIDYHKEYYHNKLSGKTNITKGNDDYGNVEFREGNWVITLKRKQEILLNSVFGVDIDSQAVEVTQLSLFLKLLEDESVGTTTSQQSFLFSKVLPDLTSNIRRGNSLVGWDIMESDVYNIEEQKKINPFDYENSFKKVFDNDGFDVIVGNPPYLKERGNAEIFAPVAVSSLGKKYHQGKMDYWYYFVHKAIEILKPKGFLGYITNSYWMNNDGASLLRENIKKNLQVLSIIDYDNSKVFKDVNGKHNTAIFRKNPSKKYTTDIYIIKNKIQPEELSSFEKNTLPNSSLFDSNGKVNLSERPIDFSVYDILSDYYDSSVGVQESTDKVSKDQFESKPHSYPQNTGVFVLTKNEYKSLNLNANEKTIVKPYVSTNDVMRYSIKPHNQYLIYTDKVEKLEVANNNYPNIKRHLDNMSDYITSSNAPYGIHRARKQHYFDNPKLICKGMFATPEFYLDYNKIYCGFSFSVITQSKKQYSLPMLLAFMNSKLGEYWFKTFGKKRGIGVDIGVKVFRHFPIPKINFKDALEKKKVQNIETLVINITEAISLLENAKTSSDKDFYQGNVNNLDRKLNTAVYDLYNFNSEEIKVIEKC